MILPPSWSTSLSRNVTRCSSAAVWTARTRAAERVGRALGTLGLDDLVRPGEADEGDRRMPVLAFERADLEELGA